MDLYHKLVYYPRGETDTTDRKVNLVIRKFSFCFVRTRN